MKLVVITVSDRASRGIYPDLSGPEIERRLKALIPELSVERVIVPDEEDKLLEALNGAAGTGSAGGRKADVVITTGGTGIGPRDITPEVTGAFCDRLLPGIAEILRSESYRQTTSAMLSRGIAGMKNGTIIVNVPGSVKGAGFCAELLAPILSHAEKMLRGEGHEALPLRAPQHQPRPAKAVRRREETAQRRIPLERLLLYRRDGTSLLDYGIQIPVLSSRVEKTLDRLRDHPVIGPRMKNLLMEDPEEDLTREDILRVHAPEYVDRLYDDTRVEEVIIEAYELLKEGQYHRYEPASALLPLRELFREMVKKSAGTFQTAARALETGFCYYFGGGFHHAHRNFGHGFCLINDSVIALRKLQGEGRIGTGWIIDVDVHKGDGTAALTRKDPSIRTLSVHMARGWPLDRPPLEEDGMLHPSFIESDIDIPVEAGGEGDYNRRLEAGLERLAEFGTPDIAIVLAGADPYEKDVLPSSAGIGLTLKQLLQRDMLIWRFLRSRNIPAGFIMAGGYGDDTWRVFTQFLEQVLTGLIEEEEV